MVGKGEREGKKKKKKEKGKQTPTWLKKYELFPNLPLHQGTWPGETSHSPKVSHPDGYQGEKKTNPPTKNHGDPASPAHIRGMQGANETGSSHSAEGFLKATHIPNTHAPYCIYFQTNLAVNS